MAKSLRMTLLAIGFASLVGCTTMQQSAKPRIASESYLIPSSDAGIQLYIRNKHAEGMSRFSAERTVIYVNGATQASEATFDLALVIRSPRVRVCAHSATTFARAANQARTWR